VRNKCTVDHKSACSVKRIWTEIRWCIYDTSSTALWFIYVQF